ncbi:uncharacterized protein N7479_001181 [Penicillium vulpinum]|uniref:Uncharacterized protein n=1 Tax=Penicillium vulpinum TaxID=29845 RepID=A0A1V6R4T5_9EURO|nr:uncharacterized protein N7479_001181 [Penicillium vulpinum]KAJ5971263.1 hypothetical protein N7479_001181 [Penicillium vulpinum]OQD96500.1 hypothetical protein PENVUL_c090G06337 [Penicillium vulpinum]
MSSSTSNTTSLSSFSSSSSSSSASFSSSATTLVSSGTYNSSDSVSLSLSYESMAVHTSEGGTIPIQGIAPLRRETAEKQILSGITQLAVMVDRRDALGSSLDGERNRLALGIEDAKVLLGLHLCRIEDNLTREVLLETFLIHLGPTDAPWMLAPLLERLASGF